MICLIVKRKKLDKAYDKLVYLIKNIFLFCFSSIHLSSGLPGNTSSFFSVKSDLFLFIPSIVFLIIGYVSYTSLKRKFRKQAALLKKSNEVALQNEEKFRLLSENSSDVVWLSDLNFNLSYISPSVEKMLGGTVSEHLSLPVEKKIPVNKVEKFKSIVNEAVEQEKLSAFTGKGSKILELEYNKLDGSTIWVEMNVSFVRDKDGRPIGLHGITRNITEKVKARKNFKKRLSIEKLLSKISREAIHVSNVNLFIQKILKNIGLTFNVSRVYIFSFNSPTNTVSNTFEWCAIDIEPQIENLQLVPVDKFSWFLNKLMKGGVIKFRDVNRILDVAAKTSLKDQSIISILAVPLILKGRFYGFIGLDECRTVKNWQDFEVKALHSIAYVITSLVERHETETELRIRNWSMELSLVGKAISDPEGKITYVNQSFLKYWRYPAIENVIGMTVYDFWESTAESEKVVSTIRNDGMWKGELKAVRSDGTLFDALVQASIVKNEEGNPICMQASFYDITERKIWEQELIKAKEKAEESNRLKSAFLRNMSHEIRTPMNGILGFINLLKNFELSAQEKEEYICLINESGKRLMNTINDLVESSVIEVGEISLNENELDLPELMNQTYSFFKPEADRKNLFLKLNGNNELPWIKTDRNKLERVLHKLISNGIKFTNKGGVVFGAEVRNDFLYFQIRDTGQGISENRKDKLFHPFIQQDIGISRKYEGTGLGLSISKAYVETLGGELGFVSREGEGSTFFFTIPFKPVQKEKRKTNLNRLLAGKKILIAEDDTFSYLLLESLFQSLGAEILHAQTGKNTVEAFKNNRDVDLILMDIKMPEMNGIEATRQIRELNSNIPIIAQTALVFPVDNKDVKEAGCNDYILKPIDHEMLLEKIKQHLFN